MIKVLEANPVLTATVECNNCGSLLEYGNADLMVATIPFLIVGVIALLFAIAAEE